jgi:hypothetical protein
VQCTPYEPSLLLTVHSMRAMVDTAAYARGQLPTDSEGNCTPMLS